MAPSFWFSVFSIFVCSSFIGFWLLHETAVKNAATQSTNPIVDLFIALNPFFSPKGLLFFLRGSINFRQRSSGRFSQLFADVFFDQIKDLL